MVRWFQRSFMYVPTTEAAVGWLLIVVAIVTPCLYFFLNDSNARGTVETIGCIAFALFFLFLGRKLAFQSFRALLIGDTIEIVQDLRSPASRYVVKVAEWLETRTDEINDEAGHTLQGLFLVCTDGRHEIYRTVSLKEAETLCKALEELRKIAVPKQN